MIKLYREAKQWSTLKSEKVNEDRIEEGHIGDLGPSNVLFLNLGDSFFFKLVFFKLYSHVFHICYIYKFHNKNYLKTTAILLGFWLGFSNL